MAEFNGGGYELSRSPVVLIALLALITLNQFLLLIGYEVAQGYQHTQEKQGKHLIYIGIDHLN